MCTVELPSEQQNEMLNCIAKPMGYVEPFVYSAGRYTNIFPGRVRSVGKMRIFAGMGC